MGGGGAKRLSQLKRRPIVSSLQVYVLDFQYVSPFRNETSPSDALTQIKPWLRGVVKIFHGAGTKAERRRRESARIEAPKATREVGIGDGVSPFQPTTGPERASWAPPAGFGRSPGRQRIFGIFEVHRTLLVEKTVPTKPVFSLKNPLSRRLGVEACPLSPSTYAPAVPWLDH